MLQKETNEMALGQIRDIARQELIINIRNKWMIFFAVAFGLLVVGISYAGMTAEGFAGMQGFTRTSASLLNLVLYIVPLVALTMGVLSFTGEKGSTELLFSQPVSRIEVLAGKLAGLFLSIALTIFLGYSAAGVVVVAANGGEGLVRYAVFVLLSLGLAMAFLSIALLTTVLSRKRARAFGLALFLWFFFVLFYDLLALAGSLLFSGRSATLFVFWSLFGNPVDVVRVASLITLDNVTVFGVAGAALLRFLGGNAAGLAALLGVMLVWIVWPVLISGVLIKKQDI
ncbi:hypothetical protein EHM92_02255 [bacterium]|nr:MAG: hypothetical protein EHM92_02255 [bacterium]